uniref:Uncharacterized protein n=1 Tax=Cannabis sativa TaxID=3483 RepID=A0A803NTA9_CANSA
MIVMAEKAQMMQVVMTEAKKAMTADKNPRCSYIRAIMGNLEAMHLLINTKANDSLAELDWRACPTRRWMRVGWVQVGGCGLGVGGMWVCVVRR